MNKNRANLRPLTLSRSPIILRPAYHRVVSFITDLQYEAP